MLSLSIGKCTYDITVPVDNYPVENSKMVLKEKFESSGGAACNVSVLMGRWNNEAYYMGAIGYDDYGSSVKKELEGLKINTNFMETNYEKKTAIRYIIVNKANTSRTIMMIEPEVFHLKKVDTDINPDIIYSDGYEYSASIAAFQKYSNAVTVLGASLDSGCDAKEVLALAKYAKYVVFSLDFAEALTRLKADFNNPQTLLNIYKEIKDKYSDQTIVVTLKNMGAMYEVNNEVKVMPTISVTEIDRTGAGDIFDGAFTYALGKGYDIEKSIRIANISAGLSTTKYGSKDSIPLLSDVISYYEDKFGPIETTEAPNQNVPNNQAQPVANNNPNVVNNVNNAVNQNVNPGVVPNNQVPPMPNNPLNNQVPPVTNQINQPNQVNPPSNPQV